MKTKVPPSEGMSKQLAALLANGAASSDFLSELMRRGAERILQEALEGEASDFLGRGHYERNDEDDFRGYRNGYADRKLKTAEGVLHVRRPRIRDSEEPFESRLLSEIYRLDDRLIRMALELYVRGLSTRDIEESLVDQDGSALLSRSAVSRLTDSLYEEYEAFSSRDLSGYDVVYLFIDAVYESVRRYTNGQTILCAWGICSDGEKVMLHLGCAASESTEAWETFLNEMVERGLRHPLLTVHDGAPAIKAALSVVFPNSDRQRCIAHKLRNVASRLPVHDRDLILNQVKAVYYAPDRETADVLAERLIAQHSASYPTAVKCFLDDLDTCLTQLKYPSAHRRFIRTTNLLERAFVEEKRRTKTLPAHINERGAIKLVFGVLIRASHRWQRVRMTALELTELRNLRKIMAPKNDEDDRISFRLAA